MSILSETQLNLSCRSLLQEPEQAPELPGLYMLFLDRDSERTNLVGLWNDRLAGGAHNSHALVYVGVSRFSIQGRIKSHVRGDSRRSSLRRNLGMLLAKDLGLSVKQPAEREFQFGEGESRLTEWIAECGSFSFIVTPEPHALEKFLIQSLSPPLNITNRRTDVQARRIQKDLLDFRGVEKRGQFVVPKR